MTSATFVNTVPVLFTERITMRAISEADFELMIPFFLNPISQYYGGPCDRAGAFRVLSTFAGHWFLRGYGPWALQNTKTGNLLGICGLWYPEGWFEPEITWALRTEFHGQGYATEAAQRALRAAYEDFGWQTAVSVISKSNIASAEVAKRLGASIETETNNMYGPANVYRHRSPENCVKVVD